MLCATAFLPSHMRELMNLLTSLLLKRGSGLRMSSLAVNFLYAIVRSALCSSSDKSPSPPEPPDYHAHRRQHPQEEDDDALEVGRRICREQGSYARQGPLCTGLFTYLL